MISRNHFYNIFEEIFKALEWATCKISDGTESKLLFSWHCYVKFVWLIFLGPPVGCPNWEIYGREIYGYRIFPCKHGKVWKNTLVVCSIYHFWRWMNICSSAHERIMARHIDHFIDTRSYSCNRKVYRVLCFDTQFIMARRLIALRFQPIGGTMQLM